MQRRWTNPRSLYLAALLLLAAAALIPTNPVTSALSTLHAPLVTIIAPVSQAGSYVSTHLRPAARTSGALPIVRDEDYAELERDYKAALRTINGLQHAIAALEERPYYGTEPALIKRNVQRISADTGKGTIKIRAGSRNDVTLATIASAHVPDIGLQLVGRVVSVNRLFSTIHVITHTDFSPNLIEGVVIPPDGIADESELAALPRCQLRPSGSTLTANDVAVTDAERIAPGHLVLLADDTWPDAAQMLVIGRVTRVKDTEQPLHKQITVVPTTDLNRLGSFILRIPTEESSPNGAGG